MLSHWCLHKDVPLDSAGTVVSLCPADSEAELTNYFICCVPAGASKLLLKSWCWGPWIVKEMRLWLGKQGPIIISLRFEHIYLPIGIVSYRVCCRCRWMMRWMACSKTGAEPYKCWQDISITMLYICRYYNNGVIVSSSSHTMRHATSRSFSIYFRAQKCCSDPRAVPCVQCS